VPKKSKKKSKPKQSKKPKTGKKAIKPSANKKAKPTEEIMDRVALKVIVSQLKESGSDIKVLKSDSDAVLQKKVNAELQKLPAADVIKKLESIDPDKLVTVLKRDCFGIFIDLADVSCVRCTTSGSCADQFIKHLKSGMTVVHGAEADKVEEKKPENAKLTPVTRYQADRLVFVRDVKNSGDDNYYDTLQAVLDEQPGTMEELREIVGRDFIFDNDSDFMKFVTNMRDPVDGLIKLDVDLSEANKEQLRAAGVEI